MKNVQKRLTCVMLLLPLLIFVDLYSAHQRGEKPLGKMPSAKVIGRRVQKHLEWSQQSPSDSGLCRVLRGCGIYASVKRFNKNGTPKSYKELAQDLSSVTNIPYNQFFPKQ